MKPSVCIPYVEQGQSPRRDRSFSLVVDLYVMELPDFIKPHSGNRSVHLSDLPRDWSLRSITQKVSYARNALADMSDEAVILFNDADSLCKPEQIREAVRLAEEAPGLVFAFTNYCRLSQKTTESLTSWRDACDAPVEWEMYGSNSSGCVAISRESFLQVGGYDETWLDGYEDYDFAFRCAEMFGPNRRVEGDLIHLFHPRPAVEPENGRDRERFEKKWLAPR